MLNPAPFCDLLAHWLKGGMWVKLKLLLLLKTLLQPISWSCRFSKQKWAWNRRLGWTSPLVCPSPQLNRDWSIAKEQLKDKGKKKVATRRSKRRRNLSINHFSLLNSLLGHGSITWWRCNGITVNRLAVEPKRRRSIRSCKTWSFAVAVRKRKERIEPVSWWWSTDV